MQLKNGLTIPVPVAEAWRVLLDIERVAPCVPGATLTARDGDRYSGKIKVKLGPIGLTYNGAVTFVSQDENARVAVLEAAGRELRGGGTAKATVTCRLVDAGDSTDVLVQTDLAITGRPAQFGRGALAEVAGALIGQFAANLAQEITATSASDQDAKPGAHRSPARAVPPGKPGQVSATVSAPQAPAPPRRPPEPIDLLGAAGGAAVRRAAPLAVGTALLLFLFLLRGVLRRHAIPPAP
jgi:carbon monoxide dehydrogenase subunit G